MQNIQKLGKNIRLQTEDYDLVLNTNSYIFSEQLIDLNVGFSDYSDPILVLIDTLEKFKDWFKENNLLLLITDRRDAIIIFDPFKKKTTSGQLIFLCQEEKTARMIGKSGEYLNKFLEEINTHFVGDYKFIQMIPISSELKENSNFYKTIDKYKGN